MDFAVFDLVDPAVDFEAAFDDRGGDGGVGFQIVELGEDVLAGQLHHLFVVRFAFADFIDDGAGAGAVVEPVGDVGEFGDAVGMEETVHDAAVGVAAENDVFDFENADGVFDGG